MRPPVYLRIYRNDKLENVRQFSDEQIIIGRGGETHLHLDDDSVSAVHAVIEVRDSGYYISDLGSTMGTHKNGQKVFDEALQSGDEIVIGSFKIEFFIGVPKPAQAPKRAVPPLPSERPSEKMETPKPKVTNENGRGKPTDEVYAPAPAVPKPVKKTVFVSRKPDMKKSSGPIIEVVVQWQDEVLSTHHFHARGKVVLGSDENSQIVLPALGTNKSSILLMDIGDQVTVFVTPEMSGELYAGLEETSLSELKRKNRVIMVGQVYALHLNQNESIRLGLHGDLVSIYIRYVNEMPPPLLAPLFDLTASEATAVLMSAVIAALFGLYMFVYNPKPLEDENRLEEQLRKATITFNVPKKRIVEVTEQSVPQEKKVVKVTERAERTTTKPSPGRASDIAPTPANKKTPQASSVIREGGAINTGKPAAGAKSETKDVTKLGLLGTLGGKGTQKELSKAYTGSGELLGEAAKATGSTGGAEDRAGESLGGRLKNVGAGGKGSATFGIAGVGTQGKGTGAFGSGTGGIGKKGRVDLNIGEAEAEFSGSIDRDAIRRVIRENRRLFQNCYDLALRKNSDAYGKVEIQWDIEERGRATNALVKSNTVGDRAMGECLTRVIRSLTFPEPPPDQVARVIYPFVFTSQ